MKARAQSLLTGKLGFLVRAKPSRPSSAPVSKPPLLPSASVAKPPRPLIIITPKSPQRVPLSPTHPLVGINQRDPREGKREAAPVIKPYLVKKGEEKPHPQDEGNNTTHKTYVITCAGIVLSTIVVKCTFALYWVDRPVISMYIYVYILYTCVLG